MSILKNTNYMKRIMRHTCDNTNPTIMIETAFEAALPLLFVPFTFSCFDWYKAGAGHSWKCGKKLRAVAKKVIGPTIVDGFHFMYNVSGIATAENLLFIWFIADLAVDTYANWSTLMYLEGNCDLPRNGTIQGSLDALIIDPGTKGRMFLNLREEKPCCLVGGNVITIPPGCYADISYHCSWEPFPIGRLGGGSVKTWLQKDDGTIMSESDSQKPGPGKTYDTAGGLNHLAGRIIAGTSYTIGYEFSGGEFHMQSGGFTVSGHGKPQPLIPQGCFSDLGKRLGVG